MENLLHFLRKTFVSGLLFFVPFVALIIILGQAFEMAQKFMDPVAKLTPAHPVFGLEMRVLLAVGLLVLLCFLAGLFAQTTRAEKFVGRLERAILSKAPGYEYFKSEIESSLGDEEHVKYPGRACKCRRWLAVRPSDRSDRKRFCYGVYPRRAESEIGRGLFHDA